MRAGLGSGSGAALLCVLALAGVFSGTVQAAPRTVAEVGSGPGRVNEPRSVAVDQSSGDLYVADRNNFRIDKFGPEGEFLLAWGRGVADGKSQELQACGPAAEPPTRRCFVGEVTTSPGAVVPEAVAVDQSSGAVWVADSLNHRVTKFTPSGGFLLMVGKDVDKSTEAGICTAADLEAGDECGGGLAGTGSGEFAFKKLGVFSTGAGPGGLAVDPFGDLWAGDVERVQRLDPGGHFLSQASEVPGGGSVGVVSALAALPLGNLLTLRFGTDELQQVSACESGKFTLAFEGQSTEIPCGANQSTVRAALGALPAIGAGNVGVGGAKSEAKYITFEGDLARQDLEQMSASGGSPAVAVTTLRDGAPGAVEERAPDGTLEKTLYSGEANALAADSAGGFYLGACGAVTEAACKATYRLLRFDPSGNLISRFDAGQVSGLPRSSALALDEGTANRPAALYVAGDVVQAFELPEPGPLIENQHAEEILPTEATLQATLNPEGEETAYHFEYGTSEAYGAETTSRTLEEGGSPDEGFEDRSVSSTPKGLIPDTTYHFRLCASNTAGENCGPDTTFKTRTAVGIEAQWVSALSAHEATVDATLDPLGAENAFWWVEYDTSPYGEGESGHGTRTPEAPLPPSSGALHRAAPLAGLAADVPYHYRFVARGEQDGHTHTVRGPDRAFTTQSGGLGFALPDNRAWEMVSPADKHGALLRFPSEGQVQAAASGEALAYLSRGSVEADPVGSRSPEDTSALGVRTGAGQWTSRDITPPNARIVSGGPGFGLEYKLFSPDLSTALLEPRSGTPLADSASERTPYLRDDSESPSYTPLVSGCPPEGQSCPLVVAEQADVPAGTVFGGNLGSPKGPVSVAGATPDLAHVVLSSTVSLVCEEQPGTGRWKDSACSKEDPEHEGDWETAPAGSLYEWEGRRLELVSRKPAGEGGAAVAAEFGSGANSVRGAVSADGSRVFFTASGALYVRDTALGQALRLDAEQPGAFGTGEAHPVFQGASADGSVAFFTDTQNLTEDANEAGADLYRCALRVQGGELKCELADITAKTHNPAKPFESAEVQGLVSGRSDDATRLYLVARGVLDAGANSEGESAVPGQPNLYLWRQGEGTRFIATLSEQDFHDWGVVTLKPEKLCCRAVQLSAAASPSGRYLAFMSERSLTGYDNRDASSEEADQEVFLYDAEAERLICASCDPSGARPRGRRGFESAGGTAGLTPAYDPQELWAGTPGRALAAVLPDATHISVAGASLYRPRAIHDNGRLFFNAADSLVGADSNGNWDVYEYEPLNSQAGVAPSNTCTPSSGGAATARSADGCVSLVSAGTAEGESAFVDASVGGDDVFFWTEAQLSVTDKDHVTDVYDARVGGVPATLSPVAECQGEACQPPATPPPYTAGATANHHGPGNLKEKGGASRCTRPAAKARRLSRRTKKLRHAAGRLTRKGAGPKKARGMSRKAKRLAARAKRQSRQARRCRRRSSKQRSRVRSSARRAQRTHARHDRRSPR